MKKMIFVFLAAATLSCSSPEVRIENPITNADELSLVPQPEFVEILNQAFVMNSETTILDDSEGKSVDATEFLKDDLLRFHSLELKSEGTIARNVIQFQSSEVDSLGDEGYFLEVTPQKVLVEARNEKGMFYAVQTLLQLIVVQEDGTIIIPCVRIIDRPAFAYRGMHLDVCRHFFPVAFIKKYIDAMARHKFNNFHWHLTEDQGWRVQIESFPRLTEIGSIRKETILEKNFDPFVGDGEPYGGFYSKEEMKEIVSYAKKRSVNIIPEIEMPGHALAALAAYPEFSCTGGPFEVGTKWGVYEDVYCAGSDSVFAFLEKVLDEVCEIFPSELIHIGGDECPKNRWNTCAKCLKRMEEEGLEDANELQSYFIRRIEKYLESKGRHIIGWDEILEGGLAPGATVMSWRGEEGGIEAARMKHNVIMTPGDYCYFDHYQQEPVEKQPLAICCLTTTEDVYNYNPVPAQLSSEDRPYILGAQGNVWSEYMPDEKQVEYMAFPRLCALSEVLWSNTEKDYSGFNRRMQLHYTRLTSLDINYCKPLVLK